MIITARIKLKVSPFVFLEKYWFLVDEPVTSKMATIKTIKANKIFTRNIVWYVDSVVFHTRWAL